MGRILPVLNPIGRLPRFAHIAGSHPIFLKNAMHQFPPLDIATCGIPLLCDDQICIQMFL